MRSPHSSALYQWRVAAWSFSFFFMESTLTEIYTLSLHDALPILATIISTMRRGSCRSLRRWAGRAPMICSRSEEHTSELQSLRHLVCRLLLEKKKPGQRQGCRDCVNTASRKQERKHLPNSRPSHG